MRPNYQYPQLPTGHIRLLKLQPRNPESAINCSLSSALLSSNPSYEAVSYAWGEESGRTHNIVLDGSAFLIHENLWSFLVHKRSRTESLTLWVDAISIDQRNVKERNSQVQRMGEIYRAARRVLVWLGPAADDSDLAVEFIQKASLQHPLSHKKDAVYQALQKWLMRSYWARTWIIQEFVLAREIVLVCGYKQIKQKQLEKFWSKAETFPNLDRHDGLWAGLLQSQPHLMFQQRGHQPEARMRLHKLIIHNRHSLCADPRDKVYAMLGLASDPNLEISIPVDYGKDTEDLFFDVVGFCPISPLDIFRFSKLLKDLLRIESQTSAGCLYVQRLRPTALKPSVAPAPCVQDTSGDHELCRQASAQVGIVDDSGLNIKRVSQQLIPPDSLSLYHSPSRVLIVSGFRTGKVICVDPLIDLHAEDFEGPICSKPSEARRIQAGRLPVPSRGLGNPFYSGRVEEFLGQLGKLDLRRLYIDRAVLQAVCQRSFSCSGHDGEDKASSRPAFSVVVVAFSKDGQQERKIGLSFGNLRKGDAVVQFLGYETALTMTSSSASRIGSQHITGRVICVDPAGPWVDTMTGQKLQFAGINGAAEHRDAKSKVNYSMTPEELLALL